MNRSYKTVWNAALDSFVAVSEITKVSGGGGTLNLMTKSGSCQTLFRLTLVSVALLGVFASSPALATPCLPGSTGGYNPGGTGANANCFSVPDIGTVTTPVNVTNSPVIMLDSNLQNKVTAGNVYANAVDAGIITRYAYRPGAGLEAGNVGLRLRNTSGRLDSITTHSQVDFSFKDVVIDSAINYSGGNSSGSASAYGVLAGSSVDAGHEGFSTAAEKAARHNGKFSTITIENLNLKQSTTGGKIQPVFNAGLRSIQGANQDNGIGSSGRIIINNQLNMTLQGGRMEALYASGAASDALGNEAVSQIILNNSNIKLIQNGASNNQSSALKIGKLRPVGKGKGAIYSNGVMNVDASEAVGDAVKIYMSDSLWKADSNTSENRILANQSVLSIGGPDWQAPSNQDTEGITVGLKDANFRTISDDSHLIHLYDNQRKVNISVKGDKTVMAAPTSAYLFHVGNKSTATFNLNGGKYFGLSHLGTDGESTVNLSDKGVWYLKPKDNETTATVTTLNLRSGGTLNATGMLSPRLKDFSLHDSYTMKLWNHDNLEATPLANHNAFTLKGNVNSDGGVIDLADPVIGGVTTASKFTTLTLEGNYHGEGGASVRMNTVWNHAGDASGGNSASDKFVITGAATGKTTVIAVGPNGQENLIKGDVQQIQTTINTIPVVVVKTPDANSGNYAFVGSVKTEGGIEAQLAKRAGAEDQYYWTIGEASVSAPVDPVVPVDPDPVVPVNPTYEPRVPAYTLMPRVNMEQGYATLRTLHERRGENQVLAWDNCHECRKDINRQTWGRILGSHLNVNGKHRLGFETQNYGFQFGHDFTVNHSEKGSRLTGIYAAYNSANTRFTDQFSRENGELLADKTSGKGKSDAWSLGVTHTRYSPTGAYLDLVAQVSFYRNKYEPRKYRSVNQSGMGVLLSAEVGKPYSLGHHQTNDSGWLIEPQAQLIYQTIKLNKFNDDTRDVNQGEQQGLRGRIGARLAYNTQRDNYRTGTFYAIANIWHDFIKPGHTKLANNTIREEHASTWAELGVGMQLPIHKSAYLYGDVRYEQELGGPKRQGYRGTVGVKYTW